MGLVEKIMEQKPALLTIFVFTFLSVSLVAYAFFLFFAVGDKGRRSWFYGIIDDVPGASRYSTSTTRQFFFNPTSPEKEGRVIRQHVMEEPGNSINGADSGEDETREGSR